MIFEFNSCQAEEEASLPGPGRVNAWLTAMQERGRFLNLNVDATANKPRKQPSAQAS